MKYLLLAAALITAPASAVTVNPASNVTADSANTVLTIPYRDANGSFAVGQLVLSQQTTTTLAVLVPVSTGAIVSIQLYTAGALGSAYGTCISSGIGAGAWVYPSTSTTSPARACN